MGSINGVIGGITGKVGNMVFYYRNGKYVAREYIPRPSNPKTEGQSSQRLKMSLAGRLSSIVPSEALVGMSGGSRTGRRGAFNRNVLFNTGVLDGSAVISAENIVFSEGSLAVVTNHSLGSPTAVENRRAFSLSTNVASTQVVPDGYGERFVALFLNAGTSQFDYALTGLLDIPAAGESNSRTIVARVGDKVADYVVFVYVYPYLPLMVDGGARSSYLGTEEGNIVVDSETGEVLRGTVYGRSVLVGQITVPAPGSTGN